ncbi:uncharacterized protein EV420DRAFT_1181549 [Desarmillaria tabescens]|uniref:Uncharacterized protein n=1 Tax=Armillaria tabescens TaxID=1929756 RepID=A0AA39NB18_ARMTA|nr:uncharacterized protein EV420DRAFT_1181549 [Desarmillaria tabescens]KAK0462332.1 hypothetical protein EV420DRAFT_1181549 [Desarmillaria tabescens]
MGTDEGEMVGEQFVKGGVDFDSVNAITWRLPHFEHIVDIPTFPSTTELVVGPGTDLRMFPDHEDAQLIESDTAGREGNELSSSSATTLVMEAFILLITPAITQANLRPRTRNTDDIPLTWRRLLPPC